jgi:hypothetical protein
MCWHRQTLQYWYTKQYWYTTNCIIFCYLIANHFVAQTIIQNMTSKVTYRRSYHEIEHAVEGQEEGGLARSSAADNSNLLAMSDGEVYSRERETSGWTVTHLDVIEDNATIHGPELQSLALGLHLHSLRLLQLLQLLPFHVSCTTHHPLAVSTDNRLEHAWQQVDRTRSTHA